MVIYINVPWLMKFIGIAWVLLQVSLIQIWNTHGLYEILLCGYHDCWFFIAEFVSSSFK
jgi:hypothetical protein